MNKIQALTVIIVSIVIFANLITQPSFADTTPTRGVISIAFDDGFQNPYSYAYPILQSKGIPASFYVITGWINSQNQYGTYMTTAELIDLQNNGNEIGSHTVDHANMNSLDETTLRYEYSVSKATLESWGLNVVGFAYPNGRTRNAWTDSVGLEYYQYVRSGYQEPSVMTLPWTQQPVTAIQGDLGHTYDLDVMKAAVDRVAASNGWTVFCFHDVSDNQGHWINHIGTDDFTAFLDYIQAKGVATMTVAQALNLNAPHVTISPTSATIAINQSKTFTSSVSGGTAPYSYQWYLNETAVPDATSRTWTLSPTQTGHYNIYLKITDSLNNQTQSNTANNILVYDPSQTTPLVPDWFYVTQDFFNIAPDSTNPVLTAANVTDRVANLVADPFMFHENDTWYMFFDVYSDKGEIGLATSSDGYNWTYQHIVLSETFDLSFPYVFKWEGTYYMIPETSAVNQIRLYKASDFPNSWTLVNTLISGQDFSPEDSSIFRYNDTWWMFTSDLSNLYLFYSDNLTDPISWHAHPMNPIVANDPSKVLGGGRVIVFDDNRVIRLTKKCDILYGEAVRAFEVDQLTKDSFAEHEANESPVVAGSGSGWNSVGMHNIDPWWTGNGWLAAVDGYGDSGWSIGIYASPLEVSVDPTQVRMVIDQSQTFLSFVSGGTPDYQYQWVLNDAVIQGATNSTWTFTPTQTGQYSIYVDVIDGRNNEALSTTVNNIKVYDVPSVSINPIDVNTTLGVSLHLDSIVSGGVLPYHYQWFLNNTVVSDAVGPTWTFTSTSTGTFDIYLNVTDSSNYKIQSNRATINVYSQPSVTITPNSIDMTNGATQLFTSVVTGGLIPYTYQWYYTDGTEITGAQASTLTFKANSTEIYSIYLNVTDNLNYTVQSNTANINVYSQPAVSISPALVNMTNGTSQTFSSAITGGIAPYSYQWYLNGTVVTGAASPSWIFTPELKGTYLIYLNVTDNGSITTLSNNATVRVGTTIIVDITPNQVKMDIGQSQTFNSTLLGGTPPYIYQWYLNGTAVSGATSQNWTFTPMSTGNYKVYLNVTDAMNFKVQSNIVTDIKVYPQLTVSINPISVNMVVGTVQKFNSTISGGAQPYTYQWYLNGNQVPNANSSVYTFTATSPGNFIIYLTVSDNGTAVSRSDNATLAVETLTNVTINPAEVKIYLGQAQTFNSTISGGVAPYFYQWYINDTAVSGATYENWTFTPTIAGNYKVYLNVTDVFNFKVQSNIVTNIIVYSQLIASISPLSVNMSVGTPQVFISTVSGGAQPYTYKWYLDGTQIPNANVSTLIFTPTSAGNFIIYLTVADNNTASLQSNNATITAETTTNVNIAPTQAKIDLGQSIAFNSTVSGGTAPYSYQWYLNDTAILGATNHNWVFTPTSAGHYKIYLNITDALSIKTQSNIVTDITVYPQLTVSINPTIVNMTVGMTQTFNSTILGGTQPYTYQWVLNGTAVSGANSSTWNFTPTQTGHYSVYLNVVDSLNSQTQSNIVSDIFVYLQLSVSISPTSTNIALGGSQQFNSTVTGGVQPYTYQWVLNGTAVSGATNAIWNFTPTQIGYYNIYVNVTDTLNNQTQSNTVTNILVYSQLYLTINLQSGGSGYTTPAIIITGGGGTGATATARVSNGVIFGIVLTNPGSGYTSAPTVIIKDPSPRAQDATATAILTIS